MPRPADDWWADVEQDFLACLEGDGSTSIATIARRLAISEDAASSLVAILAREGKVRISVVERVRRGDEAAEERDTMADQEQTALWADANRRVLDDLSELSIAAVKETSELLADLQRSSLAALRGQHDAAVRWHAMWPELFADPLRWYQKVLLESVDTAQRTFRLIGANAKALSQAVDRVHATAEQTGQRVQETLSTSASRAREAVRRAA